MIDGIDSDGLPKLALPLAYGWFVEFLDGGYNVLTSDEELRLMLGSYGYEGVEHYPVRKVAIYAVD